MKIRLNLELEIPETLTEYSDAELQQLLFDAYVNYATVNHLHDALQWACEGQIGTPEESLSGRIIYGYHNTWADICSSVNWSFSKV